METEDGLARMAGLSERERRDGAPPFPPAMPDRAPVVIAYGIMILYSFALGLFAGWLIWR